MGSLDYEARKRYFEKLWNETIPPLSNSDHCGIRAVVNRKVYKQRCKSKGRKIWRYTYADWNAACEAIDEFDWDTVLSESIDGTWENWLQQFMSSMNQFIPNCTLHSRHNLPWLTKSLVTSSKKNIKLCIKGRRYLATSANTSLPPTRLWQTSGWLNYPTSESSIQEIWKSSGRLSSSSVRNRIQCQHLHWVM